MKRSSRSGFWQLLPGARRTIIGAGREAGSQLFEFALVLPLLAMLVVGIIYGGITFYDYVTLADAVAVGARTLATNRGAGAGPPDACTLAENALVAAAANLNSAVLQSGNNISITFPSPDTSTCSALQPGEGATVQATYPCYLTIPFINISLCPIQNSSGSFISATTTVRIE